MAPKLLEFSDVTFYHDSIDSPVFEGLSLCLGPGWTGIVGANWLGQFRHFVKEGADGKTCTECVEAYMNALQSEPRQ